MSELRAVTCQAGESISEYEEPALLAGTARLLLKAIVIPTAEGGKEQYGA